MSNKQLRRQRDLSPAGTGGVDAPLLLTAREAARLCGRSVRTWRTWDAAGRIPQPVHIGRTTLWRADELRAWVAASCPRRKDWEIMQT